MSTMQVDLNGKVALVTGAAGGIGKAIAQKLLSCGANVFIADVQAEAGEATAAELGDSASFVRCDIRDPEQVNAMINTVVEKYGHLDIMVNNAGINTGSRDERVTSDKYLIETWQRIIDVDLNGTFYCCKAASTQMVKQGSGNIVNIASVAGVVALRLQVGFVAAKAAVIKMTEAMACELAPLGVRVNAVSPGSTLIEATRKLFYKDKEFADRIISFIPERRPGEAEEMADAVAYLVSDAASYVNGHNLIVDGGWTCGFNRDF